MARIRTLKPEHRSHRKVGRLPDSAYRLWVSMILEADDHGRLVCDTAQLRAVTWPYYHKITVQHVEALLGCLVETRLVRCYEVDGVRYADFPSWTDHQRIAHPTESKLPTFQDSRIFMNVHENSRTLLWEGKGSEGRERNGREAACEAPPPPAPPANGKFQIPASIQDALARSPRLGAAARLHAVEYWQAEIRANNGVDFPREILRAEAYLAAHPEKHYRRLSAYLHRWLGHADRAEATQ